MSQESTSSPFWQITFNNRRNALFRDYPALRDFFNTTNELELDPLLTQLKALAHYLKFNIYDSFGSELNVTEISLIEIAAFLGKTQHIHYIEQQGEVTWDVEEENRLIKWAALGTQLNLVRQLLGKSEIYQRLGQSTYYESLLVFAAAGGHPEIARELLAHSKITDAMIDEPDFRPADPYCEAFVIASLHQNVEFATVLLENSIIQSHVNGAGNAALNAAIFTPCEATPRSSQQLRLVQILLAYPAVNTTLDRECQHGDSLYRTPMIEAADNLNLSIVKELMKYPSGRRSAAIEVDEETPLSLISEKLTELSRSDNVQAEQDIHQSVEAAILRELLQCPAAFADAEAHANDNIIRSERFLLPFIYNTITSLREEIAVFEQQNPNGVFDVNAEKAELFFYMIRHCIRQIGNCSSPDLFPMQINAMTIIQELVQIPAVRRIAHTVVRGGRENELVRLALRIGNEPASRLLLTLPDVRRIAEEHDYYEGEIQGDINLRELAEDDESSMYALSTEEQVRLQAVFDKYQSPLLTQHGTLLTAFDAFVVALRNRYNADPATITTADGSSLQLPRDWQDFQALDLNEADHDAANTAYFQHPVHTALRYFMKPNQWISLDGKTRAITHAFNNQENLRYAWFEEYRPLIAVLWAAASDDTLGKIDDYDTEDRQTLFIKQLALMGRAHNWDRTRINLETGESEEHDDEEDDKPTCYSGAKRRLFQAVQGHPLLKILTLDTIKQELREFVHDYYNKLLVGEELSQFREAITEYYIELDATPLKRWDISADEQARFIQSLNDKYGAAFTTSQTLQNYISRRFACDDKYAHVIAFYQEARIEKLVAITDSNHDTDGQSETSTSTSIMASISVAPQAAFYSPAPATQTSEDVVGQDENDNDLNENST